ncbi:MAG: hypothetical protein PHW32_01620 [Bacilli bacterium]|nr:hypothetical protein [Bacilli bacterium]MDD4282479.1 hypothetical protein [Bacilli bacterium]MDD4719052.1 hypothetical protein [Bacilli bacterium]
MLNYDYINNSSLIITRQIPKKIISWITILIITLVIFLIVGTWYEYPKYLNYHGNVIREEEKYLIKTMILEDDLIKVKKSKLIIDKNFVNYKINYINPIYYINQQEEKYYELILDTELNDNIKLENLPILMRFELSKTTLMRELIDKLKKGMM